MFPDFNDDEKDIKTLTKNVLKDFMPGEESKIDILTNYVRVSSIYHISI